MMKSLTSDAQLDTNLKPIKSGEELSSLELSTKGNGARNSGDLEITGELKAGSFVCNDFYHIMNVAWYAVDANLDYLPLPGYIVEQSSLSGKNEYIVLLFHLMVS